MKKELKGKLIKSTLLAIGLTKLTLKEIDRHVDELKKRHGISDKKSEKMAQEFVAAIKGKKQKVAGILAKHVKSIVKELDLATKQDIAKAMKKKKASR